jgi:hypothetical protein
MATAGRQEEVELADAFFAKKKRLSGSPPEFGPRVGEQKTQGLWRADWPLTDENGISLGGEVRFNHSAASRKPFSICLVFRERPIYRVDFVDSTECHNNPYWGASFGLDPRVCGPHAHPWLMNRDHILCQDRWYLDCRFPLQAQIRRFDQAFPWFADQVNLELGEDGRSFRLPQTLL